MSAPAFFEARAERVGDALVRLLFVGRWARGSDPERGTTLRRLVPRPVEPAWLEQVHGADVLDATPGANGRADGLTTARDDLAVAVVTADCVPVLLADADRVGAVHAGWRGIVGGIVPAALERFDPETAVAWIGPSIGVDRYEVSEEVGAQIAEASAPSVLRPGARGRPHADLVAAVRHQLEEAGVRSIRSLALCTHAERDRFHSYRRDGSGAGRNWSVIWRSSAPKHVAKG